MVTLAVVLNDLVSQLADDTTTWNQTGRSQGCCPARIDTVREESGAVLMSTTAHDGTPVGAGDIYFYVW